MHDNRFNSFRSFIYSYRKLESNLNSQFDRKIYCVQNYIFLISVMHRTFNHTEIWLPMSCIMKLHDNYPDMVKHIFVDKTHIQSYNKKDYE